MGRETLSAVWIERAEVERFRETVRPLGVVAAEVDLELRYVWVENPHPDFQPAAVVGKRDDELLPSSESLPIMKFKRRVILTQTSQSAFLDFERSDGLRRYRITGYPLHDELGRLQGLVTLAFDA